MNVAAAARRVVDRRLRAAWVDHPGPALRAATACFGVAVDARHFLYDAGLRRARRAPLPVVSVGGLTVGGSGKTPLAAELTGWLGDAGERVAILSRGYADEMAVHRALAPGAIVLGHADRLRAARAAAARGATAAVLDDGFQHLRLARDLDVLLVDVDALTRTNRLRLPAGPFRERLGEIARADAIVLVRRSPAARATAELSDWLTRRLPTIPLNRCALLPGRLRPGNPAAEAAPRPRPALALTGVMKPNLFFEQVETRCPELEARLALPDHAVPTGAELAAVVEQAAGRGIVTTLKDAVKLHSLVPDAVPIWYLEDRVEWEAGAAALRARVERVVAERRASPHAPGRPLRASGR